MSSDGLITFTCHFFQEGADEGEAEAEEEDEDDEEEEEESTPPKVRHHNAHTALSANAHTTTMHHPQYSQILCTCTYRIKQ